MGNLQECCVRCCEDRENKDDRNDKLSRQNTINEIKDRKSVKRQLTIFNKSNKILWVSTESQSTTAATYKLERANTDSKSLEIGAPKLLNLGVSKSGSSHDVIESQTSLSEHPKRSKDHFTKIMPWKDKPTGAANTEGQTTLIYYAVEKDQDIKYDDEPEYEYYNLPINNDIYEYDGESVYPLDPMASERKPVLNGMYYIKPVDNEDYSIRGNKEGKNKPCKVANNTETKYQQCMLEKCHKNFCYVQLKSGEFWTMQSGQLFGCDKVLGEEDDDEVLNQHFKILPTAHSTTDESKVLYTIKCRNMDYLTVKGGDLISEKRNKDSKQLFYLHRVVIEP